MSLLNNSQIKMYTWLITLGAIPFILGAILALLDIQNLIFLGELFYVINSYALIIVIFMSGVHWGICLSSKQSNLTYLLLTSNAISILSWLAFLIVSTPIIFILFSVAFLSLLIIDIRLYSQEVIPKHYFITRCVVTTVVITSLIILFASNID